MEVIKRIAIALCLILSPSLANAINTCNGSSPTVLTSTLTITSANNGQTFNNYKISTTNGPCVIVNGASTVTLQNMQIGPCGTNNSTAQSAGILIEGSSSGINVYDSYIHVENLSSGGADDHEGILVAGASNVTIQGNVLAFNESNIEVNGGTSSNITVNGNFLLNPRGPFPRGQHFQSGNNTSGVTIENNRELSCQNTATSCGHSGVVKCLACSASTLAGDTFPFFADQEDANNFFQTSGTVTVTGNWIEGGDSPSGQGILFDNAGTPALSGTISNNVLKDIGHGCIGPYSGSGTISGNKCLSLMDIDTNQNGMFFGSFSGTLPNGPWTVSNNLISMLEGTATNACNPVTAACGFNSTGNDGTVTTTLSGNTFDDYFPAPIGGPGNGSAYATLNPIATTNPPPTIPPVPKNCFANSPYSQVFVGMRGTPMATLDGSGANSTMNVACPSPLTPNDVIVVQFAYDGANQTVTAPANYNLINKDTAGSPSFVWGISRYYHVWNTGDSTTPTFSISVVDPMTAICSAYYNVDVATPVRVKSANNANTISGSTVSTLTAAGLTGTIAGDRDLINYLSWGAANQTFSTPNTLNAVINAISAGTGNPSLALFDLPLTATTTNSFVTTLGASVSQGTGSQVDLKFNPTTQPTPGPTPTPTPTGTPTPTPTPTGTPTFTATPTPTPTGATPTATATGTATPTATATATSAATPTPTPIKICFQNVKPTATPGALNSDAFCANQANLAGYNETTPSNTNDGSPAHWNSNNQIWTTPQYYYNNSAGFGAPAQAFSAISGNYAGTTPDIIRWAACKWGVDENWAYAESQEENGGWFQDCAQLHGGSGCNVGGDCGNPDGSITGPGAGNANLTATLNGQLFHATDASGNVAGARVDCNGGACNGQNHCGAGSCGNPCGTFWASWGIIQNKIMYAEWPVWPMAAISTAWAEDYRWAKYRACMNGEFASFFNGNPPGNDYSTAVSFAASNPTGVYGGTGPHSYFPNETNLQYLALGCIGTHFSGDFYSSNAQGYINSFVNTYLTPKNWPGSAQSACSASSPSTCITITSPAAGATVMGNVPVTTQDVCSGLFFESLFIDGTHIADFVPGSVTITTTNFSNGSHSVMVTSQSQNPNSVQLGSATENLTFSNQTPTATATPTPTLTPAAPTPTITPTPTPTSTFTATPTATQTQTATPTFTPNGGTPTATPVPSSTPTSTFTPLPSATPTGTPTPRASNTPTPNPSPSPTPAPPCLVVTSPLPGALVSGMVGINTTDTCIGVTTEALYVDGVLYQTAPPGQLMVNTTGFKNGFHTLTVVSQVGDPAILSSFTFTLNFSNVLPSPTPTPACRPAS